MWFIGFKFNWNDFARGTMRSFNDYLTVYVISDLHEWSVLEFKYSFYLLFILFFF